MNFLFVSILFVGRSAPQTKRINLEKEKIIEMKFTRLRTRHNYYANGLEVAFDPPVSTPAEALRLRCFDY